MRITETTLSLIREFEGFRAQSYRDAVGIWTIGYGTTGSAGLGITPRAGLSISQPEAERLLFLALERFAAQIRPGLKIDLTENQFGALLSLAYNIGPEAFLRSTLLKELNAGRFDRAADQFLVWTKASGRHLPGLKRRRAAERALFLSPPPAVTPPAVTPPAVTPPAVTWPAVTWPTATSPSFPSKGSPQTATKSSNLWSRITKFFYRSAL